MLDSAWPSRQGISLVEGILILAILLVAITLMIPVVQRVQANASRKECAYHLQQLALAIHCFHDHHHYLPPSRLGEGYAGWPVLLLPYFGQEDLAKNWVLHKTYYEQRPEARLTGLPVFFCPARRTPPQATTIWDAEYPGTVGDYAGCAGDGGHGGKALDHGQANGTMLCAAATFREGVLDSWTGRLTLTDLKDGLGCTLLIGERHVPPDRFGNQAGDGPFYNGRWPRTLVRLAGPGPADAGFDFDLARSPKDQNGPAQAEDRWQCIFGSAHQGICQFVAADGSVRSLSVDIDLAVLRSLVVRNDGRSLLEP